MHPTVELQVRGETRFHDNEEYLDDRVRLFRDALVLPGFTELLELGVIVAV
jgi:hypothetical protein